jgi:hypothetical protein
MRGFSGCGSLPVPTYYSAGTSAVEGDRPPKNFLVARLWTEGDQGQRREQDDRHHHRREQTAGRNAGVWVVVEPLASSCQAALAHKVPT